MTLDLVAWHLTPIFSTSWHGNQSFTRNSASLPSLISGLRQSVAVTAFQSI